MNAIPHKQYLRYNWQIAQKQRQNVQDAIQPTLIEMPRLKLELNAATLFISFLVFIALITMITLLFAGKGVTKGYIVKQLEAERQTLTRENDVIGSKLAGAQSAQSVLLSRKMQSMRRLNDNHITFIRAENNLAQR